MSNGSEAAVYVRPPSDDELLRSFERKVQNVRHSFRKFPNDRFSQIPESALNKPSTLAGIRSWGRSSPGRTN